MKMRFFLFALLLLSLAACSRREATEVQRLSRRVLLISRPALLDSAIFKGTYERLLAAASPAGLEVDSTTQLEWIDEDTLQTYAALVLLDVEIDSFHIWNQSELERYVQSGGGLVSLGNPTPLPYVWPWFARLDTMKASTPSGAWFARMPYDGGRVARLEDSSRLQAPALSDSLLAAIDYAIGDNRYDYAQAKTLPAPRFYQFTKVVLDDDLNEPMEMAILPGGKVVFIERRGRMKLYDPYQKSTRIIAEFDVCTDGNYEDGLLGLALDPNYGRDNHWLYLYYSPPCDTLYQFLSRFEFRGDSLDRASEKVVLKVGVQRETCCHSGGSLSFGPDGLLYLSTGDNTSSKESDGFTPIDERPGRGPFDAQKSSSNTHDLRGKILRIQPEADGTYSIPDGNLFPKDGSRGRPEIYVMGARNPFRIHVDQGRNWLYWGDVGPDGGADGLYGPQSYDEWNQARSAGNYGWPYFVADNKGYPDRDFATGAVGPVQDPRRPLNRSPYNTGDSILPPARPALMWYPYGPSAEFPSLGVGSRSAMAGPVFYEKTGQRKFIKFPKYYEGKLFIYEWARSWIKVVSFDTAGLPEKIEPFLPEEKWSKPIDVEFGPDGALYVLEYGNQYFYKNPDAKLSRIQFTRLNQAPVARIAVAEPNGAAPHRTTFSAAASFDYDRRDSLHFRWFFTQDTLVQAQGPEVSFTFREPGIYDVLVEVRDRAGATARASTRVQVGNSPPQVALRWPGNQSFYFPNSGALPYEAVVRDQEDSLRKQFDPSRIQTSLSFLGDPEYARAIFTGQKPLPAGPLAHLEGKRLLDGSDCRSCHHESQPSVGPAYVQVARRYQKRYDAVAYLTEKVIRGGNGNWGEAMMAAHPQLKPEEVGPMIQYILSLAESSSLPARGVLSLNQHDKDNTKGSYLLSVSYTDGGYGPVGPIQSRRVYTLRPPLIEAEDCDRCENMSKSRFGSDQSQSQTTVWNGSLLAYREIDLQGIRSLSLRVQPGLGGRLFIRQGSPEGPLAGSLTIPPGSDGGWRDLRTSLKGSSGLQELFFIFEQTSQERGMIANIDWISFER